jgi:hypothetical protein
MINRNPLVDPATGHLTDQALSAVLRGELFDDPRNAVKAHLARCSPCQSRFLQMNWDDAAGAPTSTPSLARMRARLEWRLGQLAASPAGRVRSSWPWVYAAAVCVGLGLLSYALFRPAVIEAAALPVPRLTPGAVDQRAATDLCVGAPRRLPRTVSRTVRQRVLDAYRMTNVPPAEYELDYLITPELGGTNDAKNLWPQRHSLGTWNARVKDDLEALLPRLVCTGQVDLQAAQRDIARNWIEAYQKYFHVDRPIPTSHGAEADDDDIQIVDVEQKGPLGDLVTVTSQGDPRAQMSGRCDSVCLLPLVLALVGPANHSADY